MLSDFLSSGIKIKVMDKDTLSFDDYLGEVEVSLQEMVEKGGRHGYLVLLSDSKKETKGTNGTLRFTATWLVQASDGIDARMSIAQQQSFTRKSISQNARKSIAGGFGQPPPPGTAPRISIRGNPRIDATISSIAEGHVSGGNKRESMAEPPTTFPFNEKRKVDDRVSKPAELLSPNKAQVWLDPSGSGVLKIYLQEGRKLPSADSNGLSDPYCILTCGGQKQTSKIIYKTLDPDWRQTFELRGVLSTFLESGLTFKVMDKDTFSFDDHLGDVEVNLEPMVKNGGQYDYLMNLVDPKKEGLPGSRGTLKFTVTWLAQASDGADARKSVAIAQQQSFRTSMRRKRPSPRQERSREVLEGRTQDGAVEAPRGLVGSSRPLPGIRRCRRLRRRRHRKRRRRRHHLDRRHLRRHRRRRRPGLLGAQCDRRRFHHRRLAECDHRPYRRHRRAVPERGRSFRRRRPLEECDHRRRRPSHHHRLAVRLHRRAHRRCRITRLHPTSLPLGS